MLVLAVLWSTADMYAVYSSNGWIFSVKTDGTASLSKPVSENWETRWSDTYGWVNYFDGYTDRVTGSLSIPASVTEQTITWDRELGRYHVTHGETYVVTEIGYGLTTAQREALTSVSIAGTVTTIAYNAFRNCKLPSVTIPSSVTYIGSNAFENNTALMSITIPASVESIGSHSFAGCTALVSANIENSTVAGYQFSGCKALKNITFSNNVTTISSLAFENCSAVETLNIPASVTNVHYAAFKGMTGLRTVKSQAKNVGEAFRGMAIETLDLTGTETIAAYAFSNCDKLRSVTLTESLKSIGNYAFQNDSLLTSITIPASVTTMGHRIFLNCKGLESATILNSIIELDEFSGCTELKNVTFSDNLLTIGVTAFTDCVSIETLTIPVSVTSISTSSFKGMTGLRTLNFHAKTVPAAFNKFSIETLDLTGVESITAYAFANCDKLRSVILAESLKNIGNNAFQNDSLLTNITIPASVTTVGSHAFADCKALESATILNSLIGSYQFAGCTALKNITFSNNLTTINSWSFWNCTAVETLTIPASVTSVNYSAFSGMTGLRTLNFHAKNMTYAFGEYPLETVDLTGVETLSPNAFQGCIQLKSVTFSNSLKSIGYRAFRNCDQLRKVTVPSSVTSIGSDAFARCVNLDEVTVRWETPLKLTTGNTPFGDLTTRYIRLNIPEGTDEAYLLAEVWRAFLIETGRVNHYYPRQISNSGHTSITICGGRLTDASVVELIGNGTTIRASSITEAKQGEYEAAFELRAIPTGKYDLRIKQVNAVDTLLTAAIDVQGRIYPKVVSSIEGSNNFLLRRGFPTTSHLVLRNTGNIDALGVNAYVCVPEEIEIETERRDFKDLIDTSGSFDFYCADFDAHYSIPNSIIAEYMDMIDTGSIIPVDSIFETPFKGVVYQIYVPRIAAGSTLRIPIKLKATTPLSLVSEVISGAEPINTFNPIFPGDSVGYLSVEKLSKFTDLYIGIQDSTVLQKIADFATWEKTWKIADDLIRKVLADDSHNTAYTSDPHYYDYGIYQKQMATIILMLEALSVDYSSEQRDDGIINFYGYKSSPFGTLKRAPSIGFGELVKHGMVGWKAYQYGNFTIEAYRMAMVDNQDPNRQGLEFFTTMTPEEQVKAFRMVYQLEQGNINKVMLGATRYGSFIGTTIVAGAMTLEAGLRLAGIVRERWDEATEAFPELEEIAPSGRLDLSRPRFGIGGSWDPNDITGPFGINDERYIPASQTMSYVIRFENQAEAELPAMFVNVYDTLDINKYDLSTFELGNIQIADNVIPVPSFLQKYYTEYDMRPAGNYIVGITAELNTETGVVHWLFETLDPATLAMPEDMEAGFLPPNITAPEGEGSVSFTVKLKENLPHLTEISNRADIIFDYNEPILTNIWVNTLDLSHPESSITTKQVSESGIKISWTGEDRESDVNYYKVYMAVDDGEFTLLGTFFNNEQTIGGEPESLYSFYVEAVDKVGNSERKQALAETSIVLKKDWQGTGTDNIIAPKGLTAYRQGDMLCIKGLVEGETWSLYTASGTRIHQATAKDSEAQISLSTRGVYIIRAGNRSLKVAW